MFGALDISISGLIAQRTRLEVISANIAGKDALLNADEEYEPFRRRFAVLAAGDPGGAGGPAREHLTGVHVAAIEIDHGPLPKRYEPGSPFADADGYVAYSNVNSIVEQANAMEAQRSYEANIAAVEATKSMMSVALRLIA